MEDSVTDTAPTTPVALTLAQVTEQLAMAVRDFGNQKVIPIMVEQEHGVFSRPTTVDGVWATHGIPMMRQKSGGSQQDARVILNNLRSVLKHHPDADRVEFLSHHEGFKTSGRVITAVDTNSLSGNILLDSAELPESDTSLRTLITGVIHRYRELPIYGPDMRPVRGWRFSDAGEMQLVTGDAGTTIPTLTGDDLIDDASRLIADRNHIVRGADTYSAVIDDTPIVSVSLISSFPRGSRTIVINGARPEN